MFRLAEYSKEEFSKELWRILRGYLQIDLVHAVDKPRAILLGGQSGAGKTSLHRHYLKAFEGNAAVINGDDFRSSHPRYEEIYEAYGKDAPIQTAKWAGAMTEVLIDALSQRRMNLIVEGTLRTAETPLSTARLLWDRGYEVWLGVVAVKPEISLVSCEYRYLLMREDGQPPRAVDSAHHLKIVESISQNIETLEDSEVFSKIEIFTRFGERIYPIEGGEPTARDALKSVLFGSWSEAEKRHYEFLKNRVAQLE